MPPPSTKEDQDGQGRRSSLLGRAYPTWFLEKQVDSLGLGQELERFLVGAGARVVAGLSRRPESLLVDAPGLGRNALVELRLRVERAYEVASRGMGAPAVETRDQDAVPIRPVVAEDSDAAPPVPERHPVTGRGRRRKAAATTGPRERGTRRRGAAVVPVAPQATIALRDGLAPLLKRGDVAARVMALVLGIDGPPASLSDVSARLDIGPHAAGKLFREAVEAKREGWEWMASVRAALDGIASASPLPIAVARSQPWAEGLTEGSVVEALLHVGNITVHDRPGLGRVAMPCGAGEIEAASETIRALVYDAEVDADVGLDGILREFGGRLRMGDAAAGACKRLVATQLAGCDVLGAKFVLGELADELLLLLGRSPAPVRLSDLVARLGEAMPNPPDAGELRNVLTQNTIPLGGDRFAVSSHSRLGWLGGRALAAAAGRVVRGWRPGFVWSTAQILDAFVKEEEPEARGIVCDDLEIALHFFHGPNEPGNLVKGSPRGWCDGQERERHTFEAVVEHVLWLRGRPATAAEVTAIIAPDWPEHVSQEPRPTWPIVRLPGGQLGLAPRDVPVRLEDAWVMVGAANDAMAAGAHSLSTIHAEVEVACPKAAEIGENGLRAVLSALGGIAFDREGMVRKPGILPDGDTLTDRMVHALRESPRGMTEGEFASMLAADPEGHRHAGIAAALLRAFGKAGRGRPIRWKARDKAPANPRRPRGPSKAVRGRWGGEMRP